MGTICILLGVIFLFGFVGLGFFASNAVLENQVYKTLIGMSNINDNVVYVIIVSICCFLGLLICLNLVMHGLNSNKLDRIQRMLKKQ